MASGTEREGWVDFARGACIVLVAVFHVGLILAGPYGVDNGIWPEVSDVLAPVRMPLFFFVSGWLASRAVTRPLSVSRYRTLGLLYLYLLWAVLRIVVSALWLGRGLPDPWTFALALLLPVGPWYLYALVVFFVAAVAAQRLLRVHARWTVVPLAVLALAAPTIGAVTDGIIAPPLGPVFVSALAANAVWFFAGVHGHDPASRIVHKPSRIAAAVAVTVFVAATSWAFATGVQWQVRPLLAAVAVFGSLHLLGLLPMRTPLARLVRAVGRRTLPVYVMQWAALIGLGLLVGPDGLFGLGWSDLVPTVTIPLVAVVIVAASWWLGAAIERVPVLRRLLVPPPALTGRPDKTQRSRGASEVTRPAGSPA